MARKTLKLYWGWTDENCSCGVAHCEDWFIVALDKRQAANLHDDIEGFRPGDAKAEFLMELPEAWQHICMHCKHPIDAKRPLNLEARCSSCEESLLGWPSERLLKDCGGKVIENGPDHDQVVVLKGRKFVMGYLEVAVNRAMDDQIERESGQRPSGTTPSRELN